MLPPVCRADAKLTKSNNLCVAVTGVCSEEALFQQPAEEERAQNMYLILERINLDATAMFSLCIGSFHYIQVKL